MSDPEHVPGEWLVWLVLAISAVAFVVWLTYVACGLI